MPRRRLEGNFFSCLAQIALIKLLRTGSVVLCVAFVMPSALEKVTATSVLKPSCKHLESKETANKLMQDETAERFLFSFLLVFISGRALTAIPRMPSTPTATLEASSTIHRNYLNIKLRGLNLRELNLNTHSIYRTRRPPHFHQYR